MGVLIDPIVYIIRIGEDLHRFGDHYTFSATLIRHKDEAHIQGATGNVNNRMFLKLCEKLIELGFSKVIWERLKNDRKKEVVIHLKQRRAN